MLFACYQAFLSVGLLQREVKEVGKNLTRKTEVATKANRRYKLLNALR